MINDEDRLHLGEDDFRRERAMLAPHVFALSEGDDPPITDLVSQDVWDHLVHLSDDVAIRTTNWIGSRVDLLHEVSKQWLFATPIDPEGLPYAPEPAYLVAEEFEASEFMALHGYYRQALGGLRNALETMVHAAAFATTKEPGDFEDWRKGNLELRFAGSRRTVLESEAGQLVEGRLPGGSVFGELRDNGWVAILYRRLCAYAHSQAGFNNADFWESNGPVYRPSAYDLVVDELRETVAVCYLLLRICWAGFQLPTDLAALLDSPAMTNWPQFARVAYAATFGDGP